MYIIPNKTVKDVTQSFQKKPLVISQKLHNIHCISKVECIAMCPIFCWIGIIGIHQTFCIFFWLTGIISYKFYKVMVWELSWSMWKVGTLGYVGIVMFFFEGWSGCWYEKELRSKSMIINSWFYDGMMVMLQYMVTFCPMVKGLVLVVAFI